MIAARPFPRPAIFGRWLVGDLVPRVEGATVEPYADASSDLFPAGTVLEIDPSFLQCRRPGEPRSWDRSHTIRLHRLDQHEVLAEIVRKRGTAGRGFVYAIELADRSGIDVWIGPDDRALVAGIVYLPGGPHPRRGPIVPVMQTWSRIEG